MAEATSGDLEEQRARIWRSLEETEKFVSEQRTLIAEQSKLQAEAAKLDRYRAFNPGRIVAVSVMATAALMGGTAAVVKLFFVP